MEYFFMFIGLGFFVFVLWKVEASEDRMYQRKINELREFGRKQKEQPPKQPEDQ